jgi:hypothetical protein
MNPRTISAASAGSITPTVISQSNADRRRRAAAAREARRQENLAANVERAEIEREYRRLREEERKANERAEARKKSVENEKIWYYAGGWGDAPLERVNTTLGEEFFKRKPLQGAKEIYKTPKGLSDSLTINSNSVNNVNAAYQGLNELSDYISDLLKTEAEENRRIDLARRTLAVMKGSGVSAPAYTPMSEEAVAAHIRIANDPNTDAETRQAMINDLKMDSEYVASHGGTNLSASQEKYLSEDVYRGGSSVSQELKGIAGKYLAAAGSTYGKAEANQAQTNVYVNQTEKARDALLQRYQARDEINNPNNSAATTAALRANMAGAAEVLSDLTESRNRLGLENAEKKRLSESAEKQYAKQDAKVKAAMKDNPYVREEADTAKYAESILRVIGDDRVDLSNKAFLREQGKTERRFGGTQWTSAGGESAEDALSAGKDKSSYSAFKSAGEDDNEFILIDSAGKKRYTLKQDNSGAFKIFGWSGDIVASSETAQGLPSALRNLDVPFDEKTFNVFNPDSDSSVVKLSEETDISGIDTAAAFKADILGTMRTNEEIMKVETARREAEEAAAKQRDLSNLDAALIESRGYTMRIMGDAADMPKSAAATTYAPGIYTNEDAQSKSVITKSDLTIVKDPAVEAWFNDAGKAVGTAFNTAFALSPVKRVADSAGLTKGLFDGGKKEDEDEEDFIVFNKDSVLSEWAGSLNEFGDMLESSISDSNALSEKLTGRKAITTNYADSEISWVDLFGSFTNAYSGGQMGRQLFENSVVNPQLTRDYDPDHLTKLKRTIGKQVIETPKYGAGILTIGDSIVSSAEKGGTGAALAAGAFWASQAGEGIVSQGLKDPEGLLLDLEAGAVLGTVTGVAARPFITGAKQAAKVGARGTGLIYPKYRSIHNEGNVEPYTQAPRSLTVEMLLDNPGERFTVSRVERTKLLNRYENANLKARSPTHPDPNDYIGGEALHVSYGSPNVAQKTLEREGLNVNVPGSTGLFADKRFGKTFRNRILILEDLPSFADRLSKSEIAELKNYVSKNIEIPAERQKYFHSVAQNYANEIDMPVLELSPKTFNFIGGTRRPRGMATDAENELGIVIPNNKPGMIDPKTGELNKVIHYKLPSNKRFVGFDERYMIPIYKVNFGKNAKRAHLPFAIENIRDTLKDTGISKVQRGSLIPRPYSKSNAMTDAFLSEDKFLKTTGKKPMNSLDELAYGSHGKEHAESVTANIFALREGSANPEVKAISDNLAKAMGHVHDSFKLGEKEMFIPHAQRTAFLIREGYFDKNLKRDFGLNDKEVRQLSSAVEKHTNIHPGIVDSIRYRPSATDKVLATADRLDLVRFGHRPNPKKLFIRDVTDQPWGNTAMLFPGESRKGSFDLDAFIEKNRPKEPQKKAGRPKAAEKSAYQKYSNNYAAFGGVASAGYLGGTNANRVKINDILSKEKREGNNNKGKEILKGESENKRYGEGYNNRKKTEKGGGYYGKNEKSRGYGYTENYKAPKVFGYDKGYSETKKTEYGGYKGYKSKAYEILPYAELNSYNPKNYINPAVYEMKAYDGKPYEAKDYSMSGYQKKVKDIFGDTQRVRPRSKDRKEQKRRLNYRKVRVENTEIPILRGEEALFGKPAKAFELPANKKTLYFFGNTVSTKKPTSGKLQKTKRRR